MQVLSLNKTERKMQIDVECNPDIRYKNSLLEQLFRYTDAMKY